MNNDILLWIPMNLITILTVHLVFGLVGLGIKIANKKYLDIGDCVCGLIFGFFYFVPQVWSLDAVVLDLRPHREVEDLNATNKRLYGEIERHIAEKAKLLQRIEELSPPMQTTPQQINS